MGLEEFEGVVAELADGYLERAFQVIAALVANQEQSAMGFASGDFLECPEKVDAAEDVAVGVGGYWG